MHIERGYRDTGLTAALGVLADGSALLVLGPVGSGRTALLTELGHHENSLRRVWWCRGHHVGGPSGEPALCRGTLESLVDTVAEEPTTVLIDDAELLDGGALERVLLLVERRAELGLRMAATHRPVRPTPGLAAVDTALIGQRGALHLGPLTADGVAAWVGEGADGVAGDLHRRTGGWPELVAADLAGSVADLATARLALLEAGHQRVLRGVCFGLPVSSRALANVAAGADVDGALAAAAAVGLVHGRPNPVPAIAEAVRADTPSVERARIAAAVTSAPSDVLAEVAALLRAVDDRSPEAGAVYELAGDALRSTSPVRAAELYDAAVRAGRTAADLHSRRVSAALAAGRPEEAVALAAVAGSIRDDALHRASGAGWAHLGRSDLAADCYLAAGAERALAVPLLLAAGRLDDARAVRAAAPPSGTEPADLVADGALAWASGDADRALAMLGRSARLTEVVGGVDDWPDTPHALAAMSAAQWLDGERAERLATTAIDRAVGGAAFAARHHVVAAWVALRAGRTDVAVEILDAASPAPGRDAMVAAAIRAALALRADEPEAMPAIHRAAVGLYMECQPDPFAPGVAAELAHLAARIGGDPASILAPLEALSRQLGDPPTIAVHLAWARLLVAVATDDGTAARAAAGELTALATSSRLAADATAGTPTRLLADAAESFADVLGGVVDADTVRSLAARMVERGLVFEASRLVGAAGIRASDSTAARALLGDLRRLRSTYVRGGARPRAVAALSEREREVARAVLEGRTHREIGAQLYISAKTVEHHVARIRQKLGAGTKAELLSAIREELARTD